MGNTTRKNAGTALPPGIFYGLAFMILALGGVLRFWNIDTNPGWYSDEGTLVEIARNLLEGRFQYLVINKSTLLAARLPLFPGLLAAIFRFTGVGITILRYVTVCLGLVAIGMLMLSLRNMLGSKGSYLALAAGLMLAIYPKAVLYSRLGFSYNLLAPLVIGIIWALYKYLDSGRKGPILIASLLVGMGTLSDVMMFTLAPVLFLVVLFVNWKHLYLPLLGAFLPFGLYFAGMYLLEPEAFLFDFRFTFLRLGGIPFIAQYPYIVFNYSALIFNDYWWPLAVAGIFLITDARLKYLSLIGLFVPVFALGRTAALPGLGYYYLIPLFPLLAVGAGSFLIKGLLYAFEIIRAGTERYLKRLIDYFSGANMQKLIAPVVFLVTSLLLFVVVISPPVMTLALGVYQSSEGIRSDIDGVLVDVKQARSAVDYVNARTNQGDLVLASPAIAWALEANAADFQMALAFRGEETLHFPVNIPPDRFSYEPEPAQASYVIVDPIWTNWAAVNMNGVRDLLAGIEDWKVAFRAGDVVVYQNPNK